MVLFLFNEINPCRICEIRFAREVWLRHVKYACGVWRICFISHLIKDQIFHNDRRALFHILRQQNISLPIRHCQLYNQEKAVYVWQNQNFMSFRQILQ